MKSKILVTGANGWLATEFIEGLSSNLRNKEHLILLGRGTSNRVFSDNSIISQGDYFQSELEDEIVGIVHLAFLTMGRLPEFGPDLFMKKNLQITNRAAEIIRSKKPKWVITVSSGAAALYTKAAEVTPLSIYGACKTYEEEELREASQDVGANIVCGRLWGALGKFMPINRNYAVSDFIFTALTNREIQVKNPNEVFRSYVDSGDFMKILHGSANLGISETLDSGGRVISISDLAVQISSEIGNVRILSPVGSGVVDRSYLPNNPKYEYRATELGIPLREFPESLSETIESHKKALGLDL